MREYQAPNGRLLAIVTDETPVDGFWIVDKSCVGFNDKSKSSTVFIYRPKARKTGTVWVGIITGYRIEPFSGEFLVFTSSGTMYETGVLVVAEVGSIIKVYSQNGKSVCRRLTEKGLVNLRDEVMA